MAFLVGRIAVATFSVELEMPQGSHQPLMLMLAPHQDGNNFIYLLANIYV